MIPLTVTAKNEAGFIGRCLETVRLAIEHTRASLGLEVEPLVVLDDCTDATEDIVTRMGFRSVRSSGGKVEAQRRGVRPGAINVFSDADILLAPEVLTKMLGALQDEPSIQVAFPAKSPLPPKRQTPLARALHTYNRRRGFSSAQSWFSGKLFAIRAWDIPPRGIRADDIYLSSAILKAHGPGAIREVDARIEFRAPETLEGMYRYYVRLRTELERTFRLCPELVDTHRRYGAREMDLLAGSPRSERASYAVFRAALGVCQVRYQLERLSSQPRETWAPVEETKCP